jgi:hypothetical protein
VGQIEAGQGNARQGKCDSKGTIANHVAALLPFKQRRCHQILSIEVKHVEQEEHEMANTAVARVLN